MVWVRSRTNETTEPKYCDRSSHSKTALTIRVLMFDESKAETRTKNDCIIIKTRGAKFII